MSPKEERDVLRFLENGKLVAALRVMLDYAEFIPDVDGILYCPYCRGEFHAESDQPSHDPNCLFRIVLSATLELESIDLRPARGLGETHSLDADIAALEKLVGDPLARNQWEITGKLSALKAYREFMRRRESMQRQLEDTRPTPSPTPTAPSAASRWWSWRSWRWLVRFRR